MKVIHSASNLILNLQQRRFFVALMSETVLLLAFNVTRMISLYDLMDTHQRRAEFNLLLLTQKHVETFFTHRNGGLVRMIIIMGLNVAHISTAAP
jgi:uncharacterized membrane protein